MTLFVDASALVAMLELEDGFEQLADAFDADSDRLTSAVAWWETVTALSRSYGREPDWSGGELRAFAEARSIRIVPIERQEVELALNAYSRYGKGRDPAGLNMGDCFAYACAKAHGARLLYKGNDFDRTDLAWSHA
ncbi:type II toxin-antitoxin system VapC family toxin [Sphingomonas sp. DT-207]|uniref:type II toxin-antitoxin system VapC family toxin n=1 Tax=Sphingomonas sp. DT-207 TaxID=3396167 RepID=UPI003F199A62